MLHHHDTWWRFFPRNELQQVYLSCALRNFAVSLLGIFVPLYLFAERGYSFQSTLLFFIFYSLVFAISAPLAAKFAARFGIKHSVMACIPFYLSFVLLLYLLPVLATPLLIISALLGISQALYWMGMNVVINHASHRKHRGEEMGKRMAFSILGSTAGPFVGGILISTIGFNAVFMAAAAMLAISAAVLFASREEHVPYHFSVRSVLNREHWKDSLYFVSSGTRVSAEQVLWPLFIFTILGGYFSLGVVGAIIAGVSAVLLLLVGRYSDHFSKRTIVRWATGFESLAWLLRSLVSTPLSVYGVSLLAAVTRGVQGSPLSAMVHDKAKGEVAGYFVSREVFICLGRILVLMVALMLDSISGGLIFHAVTNFAALLF